MLSLAALAVTSLLPTSVSRSTPRVISSGVARSSPPHCFFPAPIAADGSPFCNDLPGNNAPILGGNFDPFGFTVGKDELEINRLREAELVHCRVGMLATAGFIVQEFYHPLFDGKGGTFVELLARIPLGMWFIMTLGIGFCEVRRLQAGWASPGAVEQQAADTEDASETAPQTQLDQGPSFQRLRAGYEPGALGFDPFNLKPDDPTEYIKVQEAEITNGRLAMMAAAGFLAQEAVTGQTWGAYWGL